ncbi:MAG: hypothetical protein ABIE70_10930 [bacterium]
MRSGICVALLVCTILTIPVPSSVAAEEVTKSRGKALAYSLGPTLGLSLAGTGLMVWGHNGGRNSDVAGFAGFWIAASGLILGPSGGHVYAERRHAFSGAAIRLGCGVVMGVGLVAGVADALSDGDHSNTASAIMLTGAAGLLASATYDIATVGRSVDSYNQRRSAFSWRVVPSFCPKSQTLGVGCVLNW